MILIDLPLVNTPIYLFAISATAAATNIDCSWFKEGHFREARDNGCFSVSFFPHFLMALSLSTVDSRTNNVDLPVVIFEVTLDGG